MLLARIGCVPSKTYERNCLHAMYTIPPSVRQGYWPSLQGDCFYGAEVLFGALSFLCEPLFIGCEAYEWVLVDPCIMVKIVFAGFHLLRADLSCWLTDFVQSQFRALLS